MTPKNDIYDYKHKLEMAKKKLRNANISEKNKEFISQFDSFCFLDGLSKPRRIKLISTLIILAESYLKKDFDTATRGDIKNIVMEIESREDCSPWTKYL